nr:NADP-reducing hydrogenase subunit HndA [Chlamydiota bacterium]
ACIVRGARKVLERASDKLGIQPGETTEDGEITLETVNCLGVCALGPVAVDDGTYHGQMSDLAADALLRELVAEGIHCEPLDTGDEF